MKRKESTIQLHVSEKESINMFGTINTVALQKTKKLVKETLEENVEARSDDSILYFEVCNKVENMHGLLFEDVLKNRQYYGLPSYATVVRARRKIFEEYPELKPIEATKERNIQEQRIKKIFVKNKSGVKTC